ncbi:methyltransferase [Micromonospora sp. NPDC050397]|uniref:methyltransferase n=1 Tax=Micromonospora sp. NPDC050397 TaxID=3364279 RepID=UPI00384C9645
MTAPDILITAAGRGSRLTGVAPMIPKTLMPICTGRSGWPESALARLARQFSDSGAARIWVAVNAHPWFTALPEGGGLRTFRSRPLGEWAAVADCLSVRASDGPLVVVSGDNAFSDADIERFVDALTSDPAGCRVACADVESTSGLTKLELDGGHVVRLHEKPPEGGAGVAKAGLYYFSADALDWAAGWAPRLDRFGEQSMTEMLRALLRNEFELLGHRLSEGFHDIGTPDGLARAIQHLAATSESESFETESFETASRGSRSVAVTSSLRGSEVDHRSLQRKGDPSVNQVAELLASRKILSAVEAAIDAGVLTQIATGPVPTQVLAARLDLDPGPLEALLRVLLWNDLLVRDNGDWRLAPPYDGLLGEHPGKTMLPLLRIESWAHGSHVNGRGIRAALGGEQRPTEIPDDEVGDLAAAMLVGSRSSAPYLARLPELRACRSLADIAGGSGGYALTLTRIHPELSVVVYDRPAMLRHAEKFVAESSSDGRILFVPWNLHTDDVPEHDSALVSHVLHLLPRDQRVELLRRVAAGLPRRGLLLVHDFVYDDPRPGSALAASAVDWLATGAGFALTSDELRAELGEAGFEVDRTTSLPLAGTTLAIARRT